MSRSRGDRFVTSRSPMRTVPAVISSSPAIMRSSVDLPQPDGPTRTRNSPLATDSVTESTARTPPAKSFVTSSSSDLRHRRPPSRPAPCRGPDPMASSGCCKRLLKTFSASSNVTRPDSDTPTLTTVARLANVSVASASRALNGIEDAAGRARARDGGRRAGRLRAERRGAVAALAPHGADRVRDAGRRQPRVHDDGRLDPGGGPGGRDAADAALHRRRRRRRARARPGPQAPLRRRADPRVAADDGRSTRRSSPAPQRPSS